MCVVFTLWALFISILCDVWPRGDWVGDSEIHRIYTRIQGAFVIIAIPFIRKFKSSRFAASFRGISRLGSVCFLLRWFTGFQRSLEKYGKKFDHFPVWKNNFLGLLVWKNEILFQTWSFDMHSDNIYSDFFYKIDNNFIFTVLTIVVPVFDLGMSFGKVTSGKGLQIYIQNCVGTLDSNMRISVFKWLVTRVD